MARIKQSALILQSRQEFEQCVDEIAALQLKLEADTADYNERKSAEDKAFKTRLKSMNEKLQNKLSAASLYTGFNREELLGERQTAETKLSLFRYRKSPGVLKTLNSKWSIAKVLIALKAARQTACIKVSETLDKTATKKHIPEADLPKYGLRMEYSEEFWIEPKRAEKTPEKRLSA